MSNSVNFLKRLPSRAYSCYLYISTTKSPSSFASRSFSAAAEDLKLSRNSNSYSVRPRKTLHSTDFIRCRQLPVLALAAAAAQEGGAGSACPPDAHLLCVVMCEARTCGLCWMWELPPLRKSRFSHMLRWDWETYLCSLVRCWHWPRNCQRGSWSRPYGCPPKPKWWVIESELGAHLVVKGKSRCLNPYDLFQTSRVSRAFGSVADWLRGKDQEVSYSH